MFILQIIGAVSAFAIGLGLLYFINSRCSKKFNFSLFTTASFIMAAISLALILIGYDWYINLVSNNEDIMNSLVVAMLGIIVGVILAYSNYSHTNIIYAAGGILTQFIILGAITYFVSLLIT